MATEDKKIVTEEALRGALGVAADKTTENTALLAEANIRAFDGIISKRNFITYPTLKSGDIVYSIADNGFYTYIEQVGLDPLATDSLLPGGGSISTPKFSFMPYAEYMDGDAPSSAILYRERSTATLYRYDAKTTSLVRYADAQTVEALSGRVAEAEAGVARLAPTLEKARLRRGQRVPHLCTRRISINSVPGNVYRNCGYIVISRHVPLKTGQQQSWFPFDFRQTKAAEIVNVYNLLGIADEDEIRSRLFFILSGGRKIFLNDLIQGNPESIHCFIDQEKGTPYFGYIDCGFLESRKEFTSCTLALYLEGLGFETPYLFIDRNGHLKGCDTAPARPQLSPPRLEDLCIKNKEYIRFCEVEEGVSYDGGWLAKGDPIKSNKTIITGRNDGSIKIETYYKYRIESVTADGEILRGYRKAWNNRELQQNPLAHTMRMRMRRKSRNGNVSEWVYFIAFKNNDSYEAFEASDGAINCKGNKNTSITT